MDITSVTTGQSEHKPPISLQPLELFSASLISSISHYNCSIGAGVVQHVCVQSSHWWRGDWPVVELCCCDHISLLRIVWQRSKPASLRFSQSIPSSLRCIAQWSLIVVYRSQWSESAGKWEEKSALSLSIAVIEGYMYTAITEKYLRPVKTRLLHIVVTL